MEVAIVGGGAAGFFAAISVMNHHPEAKVVIFEKASKVLTKVKISGGGRCNLTNGCTSIPELCKAYPRGGKELKKAFHVFGTQHTMEWFESKGVPLVIQEDQCVFPISQDSMSVIHCLVNEAKRLTVRVVTNRSVSAITKQDEQLLLAFNDEQLKPELFDKVIVTTGGSPKRYGLEWLAVLEHQIENPVPSLYTFKIPEQGVTELMGVVVENVQVAIQGTKIKAEGPLLITHWGMSGPAILKLSSFGARFLSEHQYQTKIQVNWTAEPNAEIVGAEIHSIISKNPNKQVSNLRPYDLPNRLWLYLLEKCEIAPSKNWCDLGKKALNKMVDVLTNDVYSVKGRAAFKDEFVTCGGVSLKSVDMKTMQSKVCKNLYFAGEVLDIDAITGGYNLQAAWTTGFIAGKLLE